MKLFSLLTVGLVAVPRALGHPGHSAAAEAQERLTFMKRGPASVRSCARDLERRGHTAASLARREEMAGGARVKRGLKATAMYRRDFAEYNHTHASSLDVTLGSDETVLFSDNSSCILQPEVTQGPYYVDGELIRSNVVEDEAGVPLYLDVQMIDTSTCEPVPAVFVDLWHCNSTGVYSGVIASGNGNSDDEANINRTALRGIQQTDFNGVVQFETIVPGHYTGRAPHIHVLAHNPNNTIVRTNATLLGSNFTTYASHVGQLFFDQSLLYQINKTYPYNTNTQDWTLNADDSILASEADSMDPFVEYVLLGNSLSDGIMAWITLGIDPLTDSSVTSAATIYKDGGVANSDSSIGGPGGSGNGTAPSGMPSGSAPPTTSSAA